MRCVAGVVYRPGEGLEEGYVLTEGGRVVESGQGKPPQPPTQTGLILPAPVNAHTHVADRVARGISFDGLALKDAVKPPNGLKHRLLRETPRDKLVEGMRAAIGEMRDAGARAAIDFREQGAEGVQMLREAAGDLRVLALARPKAGWDDAEADEVARLADGIGLSSLSDVDADVPERAARAARKHGKRFALHFSEDKREDVARALDLRPDFLVHVCAGTREDFAAIADARVPVVLCPRSNALFGRFPDAPAMLALGVPLALGSDNAMFHSLDVLDDARLLAKRFPETARETWLDIAIAGGVRVLDGSTPRSWLRRGDEGALRVLPVNSLRAAFP